MDPTPRKLNADDFVRLFARHERRVFSYILSLVGNYDAADEIFQETSVFLWQEFGKFKSDTNFAAWACRVAHFKVLEYRKLKNKLRFQFSDEFLERVASEKTSSDDTFDPRREALHQCMQILSEKDANLLSNRYLDNKTAKMIAIEFDQNINTVYKTLQRIRRSLLDCIQRKINSQASS